jgi:hypothetical protein
VSIIWTIIIGFVAGVIAKLITPGKNEPSGFILPTILGPPLNSLMTSPKLLVFAELSRANGNPASRYLGEAPRLKSASMENFASLPSRAR